jgi:predicted nucleotidyltransferase
MTTENLGGAPKAFALTATLFARHSEFREENCMLPSQILQKHRAEVLAVMARYPVLVNLRVVGSVARGDDTEDSDIDFLVDPLPGATLFDLGGLHEDLEELLGVPVDIISARSRMHEYMRQSIEREAVHV